MNENDVGKETRTLKTFSMLQPHGDELEVEYYPTGEIKVRITKRKDDGGYMKHASMIFSGDEILKLQSNIKSIPE